MKQKLSAISSLTEGPLALYAIHAQNARSQEEHNKPESIIYLVNESRTYVENIVELLQYI